jgi:hypothetical protein
MSITGNKELSKPGKQALFNLQVMADSDDAYGLIT